MTDLRKAAEVAIDAMIDGDSYKRAEAIIELRQALAEEQEPVAWEVEVEIVNYQGQTEERTILAYRPDPVMTAAGNYEVTKIIESRPLHTAPSKRKWVDLTDEEIEDEWQSLMATYIEEVDSSYCGCCDFEFAKAIEAKLKDKNT